MNTIAFFDALRRDVHSGLRMLRRNPMFTGVAVLTLAIGIGANTAVFSVVNSVLLRPLPYPKPEQIVELRQAAPGVAGLANGADGLLLSGSMYFTYSEQSQTFQALGIWAPSAAAVTGLAEPEQVGVVYVSDGVLQALGVPPMLGRWLDRGDQAPAGPEAVMLSFGYWQQRFGGDKSVIGRTLRVEARPHKIVGVMPAGFSVAGTDAELILPMRLNRSKLTLPSFDYLGLARLKPGVTISQANADLTRLVPVWMDSWPSPFGDRISYEAWKITPDLRPLKQEVVGSAGGMLWVVMATIGLVMLMACANVANLLLVRADARQQELAIRVALGAGPGQIVRGLLIESLLLGLMGGLLGVGLAHEGLRFLVANGPSSLPRLSEISLDARALWFTLGLSLLSGLLFGSIPALKYAGSRISTVLRGAGRTSSTSRERQRSRNILIVAQVAMALVLLVSAGLMIRTFQALRTVQPGFTDAERLQTMGISIPGSLIPDPQLVTRTQNNIAEKLAAIPGVTSVGFVSAMPMDGNGAWDTIIPEGKLYAPGETPPLRMFRYVSPGYFHTMGTRLLAGRELTWTDVYGLRRKALVSENLAREIWGTPAAAIGKRFRETPGAPWWEVAGVVQDVHENGVDQKPPPIVYWPALADTLFGHGGPTRASRSSAPAWGAARTITFAIRSGRAGTEGFIKQVRQAVWSVEPSLPVAAMQTMQNIYDRSLARISFTLTMLAIAGAMALLLGMIGIYGVISYAVSQRRREIGIRLALGAQPGKIQRMLISHTLVLVGIGIAIGAGAALGLTRLMSSLLFGVSPVDPLTYGAMAAVLAAASLIAAYVPARRAAAVDPVETLNVE